MKKLVLHSGGQDSACMLLDCIDKVGADNIISLGFDYGNRHFGKENAAAWHMCREFGILRKVLTIPLGEIAKGSALVDTTVEMTVDMAQQRTTAVQLRNMLFIAFAASIAAENGCNEIYHGSCKEDFLQYRDCRPEFFKWLEMAIQSGLKKPSIGSENVEDDYINGIIPRSRLDIKIITPLINERKDQTLARVLKKYPVSVFANTWTCYNGGLGKYAGLSCGVCCSCQERLESFRLCGVQDPLPYYKENAQ